MWLAKTLAKQRKSWPTFSGPCRDTVFHMYRQSLSHTLSRSHTLRRGAAHCTVRPAFVLCWLLWCACSTCLPNDTDTGLFPPLCLGRGALILGSLTCYTWACEVIYSQLLFLHTFWVRSTLLFVDDTELCQLSVCVYFDPYTDHQTPDKSV